MLTTLCSGGFLQPDQSSLWRDHRVLLSSVVPGDEGNGRVGLISDKQTGIELTRIRFEYLWQDSENYKRPTKMPAPAYIEQLMSWVQANIDNEAVLPSRIGKLIDCTINTRNCSANNTRRSLSKVVSRPGAPDIQANVSCLRPHLLPPLPGN